MDSRPGTPTLEESDEEDHGDYDHVIGYLPAYEDSKARSRQGSYADLQRLRMTTAQPAGAISTSTGVQVSDSQPLQMRSRQRKHSLSDLIPVERIATVDREETFQNATVNLNKEIGRQDRT